MYKSLDLILKFFIVILLRILIHQYDNKNYLSNDINDIKQRIEFIDNNCKNIENKIDSLEIKNSNVKYSLDSLSNKTTSMNSVLNRIRKNSVILF